MLVIIHILDRKDRVYSTLLTFVFLYKTKVEEDVVCCCMNIQINCPIPHGYTSIIQGKAFFVCRTYIISAPDIYCLHAGHILSTSKVTIANE